MASLEYLSLSLSLSLSLCSSRLSLCFVFHKIKVSNRKPGDCLELHCDEGKSAYSLNRIYIYALFYRLSGEMDILKNMLVL